MQALKGKTGIIEPTYVYLPGIPGGEAVQKITGCEYFSIPVKLDTSGATECVNVLDKANEYEKKLLVACYTGLKGNITTGIEFVKNPPSK